MLRLGCFGCLTVVVVLTLVAALAWGAFQISRAPDFIAAPTSVADGVRAQQKIFDVLRRAGSGRPHTVTLQERELNAFLNRHLGETADMPLRSLAVRLPSDEHADLVGWMPLRQLLGVAPFSALASMLPAAWLDRGVWLSLHTRVTLEGGDGTRRHLRLDVERFEIGRLWLPEVMLRVLLDPGALRFLRWPVPDAIDGLRIEPGHLVIQSA